MVNMFAMLLLSTPISSIGTCELINNSESKHEIYAPQDEHSHANHHYYVSLNKAKHNQVTLGGLIIDTRMPLIRDEINAIQLPLHSLKTKKVLKNKSLYIIHNELSREALEQQVTTLYLKGFSDVHIIELPHMKRGLNYISAQDVMANNSYSNWFIASLDNPLPNNQKGMQVDLNSQTSKRKLYALATHYQEEYPLGKIIITAQDTSLYAHFHSTFASSIAHSAWYVKGGIQAQAKSYQFSDSVKYGAPTLKENCIWQ
ncbi:hypothetical protein [Photobacterium sanguinicancri]|uniref:Uncharacterized protein n=1 Tax=Photobacterium sanguinicancri TaxID=875932 RepID=A0AAW7Y0P0_9GAMM|nr:hypothetical protein [Photobacterium sanguinicancri]MDO6541921.1 hypothetical protein [Photobacterium sanguinicancri]